MRDSIGEGRGDGWAGNGWADDTWADRVDGDEAGRDMMEVWTGLDVWKHEEMAECQYLLLGKQDAALSRDMAKQEGGARWERAKRAGIVPAPPDAAARYNAAVSADWLERTREAEGAP
ncbi:predicted protein [Plenodomus lingam JN3]|uniref:Predicted protein n=1 Tax=Leptosphaeria maculans (strain JN3 / isolate v23.1.3 / race Av1-4-5-6-7-8) TaxID=985895 RepID=E5A7Y5_LEPMJ|nr:predicted protein [Plenodomus lingam JN3]CBX99730.1 predicted protein [Plenodomus lingam JN3]